ncbi:MAG: PDZ domain-containing protein [Kofleriaceae bacterium]
MLQAAPRKAREETVPIASIANPSLMGDNAAARIAEVFAKHDIEWFAYGSLGFTVSVPASQAERARALLRGMPNVYVIEKRELAALVAPPIGLAPMFTIERIDLDAELVNLAALIAGTKVQWNHPSGILILEVGRGSLFERMGLLPNDMIAEVDGVAVHSDSDALRVLALAKVKDRLPIRISRKGTPMTVEVVATHMP